MLKDKEFINWLNKNKIIYDKKNIDLLKALYSEYKIEKENKIIKNIYI